MLEELYASIPALECKGRCHDTCTVINASELERERMAEAGVRLPDPLPLSVVARMPEGTVPRCPALSPLNTCRVYEVRPFICRAFGVVLDRRALYGGQEFTTPMMCDHGCVPEGTMTLAEFARVILDIEELSYAVTGVQRRPRP
jgi:Fe-S-cluster containining protein